MNTLYLAFDKYFRRSDDRRASVELQMEAADGAPDATTMRFHGRNSGEPVSGEGHLELPQLKELRDWLNDRITELDTTEATSSSADPQQ